MNTYETTEDVLLMKRLTDGLYFWLINHGPTSEWGWTDDKSKAYRVVPWNKAELARPNIATYYFENSWRAREIWCVDSVMERNRIVTSVSVEKV